MRIMIGLIFADSGYNDLKDPDGRSKSIGMPRDVAIFLAYAEIAGGAAVALGILEQLAAIGLMIIMCGAVEKKIAVWKTGFWGKDGWGWNYDLTLMSMLVVILATNGGSLVLMR